MIHVKPPENILPEKKKKGKRQAEDNILQYLEPNERLNEISEDLDVFQNNKGIIALTLVSCSFLFFKC